MSQRTRIDAMKLLISGMSVGGNCPYTIGRETIQTLLRCYETTGSREYTETAAAVVYAAMEMGLSYDRDAENYDRVLALLGMDRNQFLAETYGRYQLQRFSRTRIASIVGHWNKALPEDMRKSEVVEDICTRIQEGRIGSTVYTCHYRHSSSIGMLELSVTDSLAWIHDIPKKMYYYFEVNHDKTQIDGHGSAVSGGTVHPD